MTESSGPANKAERYLSSVSPTTEQGFRMGIDELGSLIKHATRIGEFRLELLRSLQAALYREEEGEVAEMKELLTNLIIMQSRLAEREGSLLELLNRVIQSKALEDVAVDKETLRSGIEAVLRAAEHIKASTGN